MGNLPPEISNVILYIPDEEPVSYWSDVVSTDDMLYMDAGFLVLTNKRCIFVKKSGVFNVSYHQDIVLLLEGISEVSVKQSGWTGSSLTISGKKFNVKDPEGIRQLIMATRAKLMDNRQVSAQPSQTQQQQGGSRLCLGCGSQIGLQFLVCPYCQKPVGQGGAQHPGQPNVVLNVGQIGASQSSTTTNVHDSVVQGSVAAPAQQTQAGPKQFKRCPYCGEELNFPKPPKFCPYCNEQLQN